MTAQQIQDAEGFVPIALNERHEYKRGAAHTNNMESVWEAAHVCPRSAATFPDSA